jgi:hypothetical protein
MEAEYSSKMLVTAYRDGLSYKTIHQQHFENTSSRYLVRSSLLRNVRHDFVLGGASLAAFTVT